MALGYTTPNRANDRISNTISGAASPVFDPLGSVPRASIVAGPSNGGTAAKTVGDSSRLGQLLQQLDDLLAAEKYAFDVFAPNSINFGILVTYRQKWEPVTYQVGDLVSTIPLAPKEVRRYTTRTVSKKTRAVKELEASLETRKKESADTSRVDAEIVEKASNKTNFNITATETFGGGEEKSPWSVSSTQTAGGDTSKDSERVKKDFRESVLKSAEEYRHEHRTEIDTSESQETETTNFNEIQNPNDELAVTYLFYELQRRYKISEKLHKLTPVIFVANDVPAPHEITDAWLLEHDWILKRVILDDSFRPALEYLCKGLVGSEINIRILENNAFLQKNLVDRISQEMQLASNVLSSAQADVRGAVLDYASSQKQQGLFDTVKRIFDPIALTGTQDTAGVSAAESLLDYEKDTLDRAEKERRRLESQLEVAVTALQAAIDKLSSAVKEHYDKIAEIDRLRVHIKDNILFYMQAIWSHEPPDQRFFRLYKIDVPIITAEAAAAPVKAHPTGARALPLDAILRGPGRSGTTLSVPLPPPKVTVSTKKLAEVADLDNILGYKGNYMIFPFKENNYLTLHMMQDYLEVGDEITVRDPDEFGNYTLDEIQELATCVYKRDPQSFLKHKNEFKKMIIDRLTSSRTDGDEVVVPTTSLYIEALVGTHPLLEDFKLIHRALDVKKVQAEVRHAELENIRLASRALKGKDEDPDIEKKIVIEGDANAIALVPDNT
jgi:hypothetical protein